MSLEKRITEIEQYEKLRQSAWEDVMETVVKDIVKLFVDVNKMEDAGQREAEFLKRGDELIIYAWESRFGKS